MLWKKGARTPGLLTGSQSACIRETLYHLEASLGASCRPHTQVGCVPPVSSYCLLKEPLGPAFGLTGPQNHHLEGYPIRLSAGKAKVME